MMPTAQGWLSFIATDATQWYTYQNDARTPIHYAPPIVYEINASYSAANVVKTESAIEWFRYYRRPADIDNVLAVGEHFKYYSACTCVDDNPRYAVEALVSRSELEGDIPGSILVTAFGGDPNRFWMDIRQSAVRAWLADYWTTQAIAGGYNVLTLDNVTRQQSYGPISSAEVTLAVWDQAFLDLLETTYAACRTVGLKLGINLATGSTIGTHWPLFYDRCDCLSYEQPMHELVTLNNSADVADEIDAYIDAIENGKTVLLFPAVEGVVTRVVKQRIVACAAMFAKRSSGSPIFVWGVDTAGNGTPENFDWFLWPYYFGRPMSQYSRSGDVFTRRFSRGTLTLDLTTYTAPVITADFREPTLRPNEQNIHEVRREILRIDSHFAATDPLNPRLSKPRSASQVRRAFQQAKAAVSGEYPVSDRSAKMARRVLAKIKEGL